MNKDDFFYLGKILKAYGKKGHVLAYFDVDDLTEYRDLDAVFLGIDNDRIPFFIKSVEPRSKNQAVILFEDSDSADDASVFEGKELFLPLSRLPKLKGKKFYYHEVAGFKVIDTKHGDIGFLKSVLDMPQHPLLQIQHGEKEILVPLTDEILQKVDRVRKELHIDSPEGLIEIYL
jgi:16S rRNA processing protein RimM